ncbi:MAG: methylmalonyl-CoA mutase [Peptococcaceae bacterium]|nr:MAG: methylmalonyl-CoA mutase [Peptococcaceae bacterium]
MLGKGVVVVNDRGKLSGAQKIWEEKYNSYAERDAEFATNSGIPVKPVYSPLDGEAGAGYLDELGFPGEPPFTRGIHHTMYRGRLWTIRQLAGYGTAEETNRRFKFLLDRGSTGINCVFDYPTARGYDSDAPEATGDVGQGGVAIDSLADMEQLFADIPIEQISVSLVASFPVLSLTVMAMYLALAKKRGVPRDKLAGTIQNDFLMETAIAVAPAVLAPSASFRLSTDVVEYCTRHVPRWNPISYTGYNYREAGVDAVQEVALVFVHALATVEEMRRRGYEADQFVPRLSFFFSADNDFFEEIAKYRAARRLWYRLMSRRYGATNTRTLTLRYHVQTAGSALTAQEPLNNIVRAAFQGLAAVLGGAQSVHVDGYDEALCIPSEQAALVALRTQQILQNETNVTYTADPLGGGYFIEFLTAEMERRIQAYMDRIEEAGGIVSVVRSGWLHNEILEASYRVQKAVEEGRRKVVGVNCFTTHEQPVPVFRPAPGVRERQLQRLAAVRETRDASAVEAALNALRQVCRRGENAMDAVLNAVDAMATVGEIGGVLREECGTWQVPLY